MQLLHIDSSVLGPDSASRALSAEIVARQLALRPGMNVMRRDLAADAALHLSSAHLAAWQGGAVEDALLDADLAKGGTYLEELFAADIIVIGAPMYNFSIPSQLKAWIDRVVIAGKTFRYGADGAEGLLSKNTKVFIVSSRGNVYAAGSPAAAFEHHESYLTGVLSFIGLTSSGPKDLHLGRKPKRPPC
jgi:FMN-dependent NADH-azoreductase